MEDWVRVSCYDISGVSDGFGVFLGERGDGGWGGEIYTLW